MSPTGFARHLANHRNLRNYACNSCDKAFNTQWVSFSHTHPFSIDGLVMGRTIVVPEIPMSCEMFSKSCGCPVTSGSFGHMWHWIIVYNCTQFQFLAGLLVRHKLDSHRGKVFQCHMCPTSLMSPTGFAQHLAAHRNLRNYPCGTCDKAFNTKGVSLLPAPYSCSLSVHPPSLNQKGSYHDMSRNVMTCHDKRHDFLPKCPTRVGPSTSRSISGC